MYCHNTFVEYDGEEIGAGSFAEGKAWAIYTDKGDGSYAASFVYLNVRDYDVKAHSAVSRAVSSIVYIGSDNAAYYAYKNYDQVGGHNTGMYEVTYYKALDIGYNNVLKADKIKVTIMV